MMKIIVDYDEVTMTLKFFLRFIYYYVIDIALI